jgi:hypothetical protein
MIVVGGWPGRNVVGLSGRFGVRPAAFAALGDFPSPFANDVDPGDETTEFVAVVQALPGSGTVIFTDEGGFSHTGAADGTYTTTFRLYTWAQGGPITEHSPLEVISTSFGAVPGATLTAAAALIAGSATGQRNATAAGVTLAAAASLSAGAATGQRNATVSGASLVAAAALLAGTAAGGGSAVALGVTLTAAAQLLAGAATGGGAATAPGATLLASAALIAGSASGTSVAIFRPTADVSTPGWVAQPAGPLYELIDEVVPDDADFIHTAIAGAAPAVFAVGPLVPGIYTLRVRGSVTQDTGTITLRLLDAGGSTLATGSAPLTLTPTTREIELSFGAGVGTQVSIEVSAP